MRVLQTQRSSHLFWLILFGPACVHIFHGCDNAQDEPPPAAHGTSIEFPQGDPSVPADLGGPAFSGVGWTTAASGPLGDPNAVPGGAMLTNIYNWPENLRVYGTGSNTYLNSIVEGLLYESLLRLHPNTLDFAPGLATHWWISDDKMTFRYRINPKAHWSDGQPVTADDFIATYRLINDTTLVDPMSRDAICGSMEEPVAKSKYLLEVRCKKKHWRNFLTFSAMTVLPSQEIGSISGKEYLDKYNFKYTVVSGPYIVRGDDIKDNESLTLTRRTNYWADDEPINDGLFNFEKIRFVVIRDHRLAFDKARKGELDFYPVYTAKWWIEDLVDLDAVKKGHLIRRKVYTKFPVGIQGLAFNMRKPPLDDVRVRQAIAHLYDRKTLIDKFAYNEYELLKSYYPNSEAENTNNVLVKYDPQKASNLLAEAGWKDRGNDGILVKDGMRLSFVLSYQTKGLEKYFTSLKESCKKAGVEIELLVLTPETHWKNLVEDRKFQISSMAWSATLFPSPKPNYYSTMADDKGSNNITGFHSPRADDLIDKYDEEFDLESRYELLRKLDAELFQSHHYALAWSAPYERVLYWNKFGMPEFVLYKYHDWRSVFATWWIDSEKAARLKTARKTGQAIAPIPSVTVRYWVDQDAAQSRIISVR